jgi:uncharacterized protein (DUF2147 family)
MKKRIFLIAIAALCLLPFLQVNAQEVNADDILGIWLNEDEDAHVSIYKEKNLYFGKIVWLKNPIDDDTGKPKLDDENEDESLRTRPVMGLLLLRDFEFDGDDEWESGRIYDPKNGKDYKCYMEFPDIEDKNKLKVRGYIGFSLLGRTTYWTRVE